MNTTQIKCFLAVAETLNFTKASEQLFISQPGLSRQIVSLERELNTLLFIRDKHKVLLTPAAAALAQELQGFETRYEDLVHKVQKIGQGFSGTLTLGMLGGQFMNEELTSRIMKFMSQHPNIDLIFKQGSFRDLRNWLQTEEIDIAITLHFDIQNIRNVLFVDVVDDQPVLAISKLTKTGRKKHVTKEDLQNETLIIISPEESRSGNELFQSFIRHEGLHFSDIRYAPNLATVMMWIEAGQGVGLINHSSNIVEKSSIRVLEEIEVDSSDLCSTCLAWKNDNYNPAIPMFVNEESS